MDHFFLLGPAPSPRPAAWKWMGGDALTPTSHRATGRSLF